MMGLQQIGYSTPSQFKLKQIVNKPTRGDEILDLLMTNMPQLYDNNSVQTLPPFGLSDHNVVSVWPKTRPSKMGTSKRSVPRHDLRAGRKCELGRYLSCIDWSLGDAAEFGNDKLKLLIDTINIGLDVIMPVKHFKVHTDDPPWVKRRV